MTDFIKGFYYIFAGFTWIFRPKIRRFIYIPLLINIVLIIFTILIIGRYADTWAINWLGQKSDWWSIFRWSYDIFMPLFKFSLYLAFLFVSYFLFSSISNFISAPFNAKLSKAVETRMIDKDINYSEIPLSKEVWIAMRTEFIKLFRFLFLACILLLLLLVPVINIIFPFVWFVFMVYTLSLQYIDYPMANHGYFYLKQRKVLKKSRMQRIGFGVAANLLLLIPFLNFIVMPICVCAATVWWSNDLKHRVNK